MEFEELKKILFFSQGNNSSQQEVCGNTYENSNYQNHNNEHGINDINYAGGYNHGGISQQQQSSTQVYRPPHLQNRMNMQKYPSQSPYSILLLIFYF